MAHEIMEFDNMVSVHEKPWHGLGIILPDYLPPLEIQKQAGLTWAVAKQPVYIVDADGKQIPVEGNYAITRTDNNYPLGVVGNTYEPYQNDEMFQFIDAFCQTTGSKVETAGSLRNGRIVWALSNIGNVEYVKNDPVSQYFLFKNSFNGTSPVEICFTDVRVVCNNTLTMALRGASNVWRIKHCTSMQGQIDAVKMALTAQSKNSQALHEVMEKMAKSQISAAEMEQAVRQIILGNTEKKEDEISKQANTAIEKVLELNETGAGTDIKGVRGTVYGLLNAFTEYADHYKGLRKTQGRSEEEVRFESIMMGGAHDLKVKAFNHLYTMAA